MATGPRYKVPFRRRREGRTNYHLRLKLLLSRQDRVVVRKSAKNVQIQLIAPTPEGDITYSSAVSNELAKYGYTGATGNTPAAYLTGLLFGLKSLKKGQASRDSAHTVGRRQPASSWVCVGLWPAQAADDHRNNGRGKRSRNGHGSRHGSWSWDGDGSCNGQLPGNGERYWL